MDMRLCVAARTGNIDLLHSLVQNEPLVLETAALEGGDSPLHVAVLAGRARFATEILKLRPEFAEELNLGGLTPLHIASAKGNLEIVMELLKLSPQLCLVKGKDRRIPLHYAALKGRVEVSKALLSACPNSIEEITARGETALHMAVKSSQFEVFTVLVEELKRSDRLILLNRKDVQGNTLLHLAVAAKQYEVVDYILNENAVYKEQVEVNAVNRMGLTALEALSVFPNEAGDKEISDTLVRAGATSIRITTESLNESQQDQVPPDQTSSNCPETGNGILSRLAKAIDLKQEKNKWLQYFKFKKDRDSPDNVRSALLVVAALITTATYQAVLQPPGGLWQDSYTFNKTSSNSISDNVYTHSHTAGQAILGNLNPISYILFLFFNSLGFFAGIQMITYLTTDFPLQLELKIALIALITTYDTAMGALSPTTFLNFFFVALSIFLPFLMSILSRLARK